MQVFPGSMSFSWEYGMGYFSDIVPGTRTLARGVWHGLLK